MEYAPAVATVDRHGGVTGWSEGARRLTGYTAGEAVGRQVRDLLAEAPAPGVLAALSGVVVIRHRNGTAVALPLRASRLLTADGDGGDGGEHAGYVVTAEQPDDPSALRGLAFQQAPVSMSVFDDRQRFLLANTVTCRTMDTTEEALRGRYLPDTMRDVPTDRFGIARQLREVAETGRAVSYESVAGGPADRPEARTIEMWPVRDASGGVRAVAVAAFDSTAQHRARVRLSALNEAARTLGTTLDVGRTADELIDALVPRFAGAAVVDLLDWVLGVDDRAERTAPEREHPLRRMAHGTAGSAAGLIVPLGRSGHYPPGTPPARALREGRAVLAGPGDPGVGRWLRESGTGAPPDRVRSVLAVPLRARGTILGVVVLVAGGPQDPYDQDDTALAEELASRAAVCVDNARRFARERATALALQHSLLPRGLPGQAAVEVAHRYLPSVSAAGIGGDWFDVIPLSGSRVALVVGDVVGHGIPSSATMGRLCTAVRTLADVDLPPDELLTHLDDLVTHLAASDGSEDGVEGVAETGATCLYAVYDPVSRRLALAAAGHPPPAVVLPDGTCRFLPVTAGPPLGVGGQPFEAAEVELPEGSVVALYTDGLIEGRDRDPAGAAEALRRALSAPEEPLDALCDRVLERVMPKERVDDVALLLARTRALGPDRVATWDVPADPASVAGIRSSVIERLGQWGLEEEAFVTELVVSELVTNAIRYGEPPIQLRLIRDRALICEVSDASSTSPHLRRAQAFDEGGRGLLLVAQLTRRWGSRQTADGKTIWAEQPLADD
ncbi:SpoIIE family protein phosphatase [Streptomyces sp. NPDC052077]|uniref:ATP-binding SpoIIE family protein phosphatase n=1 Tax=Streptomyces sp. NPDC052077 TaxID=3154757 RepID=UPI00341AE781